MIRDEELHVDDIPEARTMTAREALRNAVEGANEEVGRLDSDRWAFYADLWLSHVERHLTGRGFAVLPAIPLPR
jgi:hypothetical protein